MKKIAPRCTMNYIGSKYKLLGFIEETMEEVVGGMENKTFCDIFSGTGIVGRYFKSSVDKVITNDLEYYSYVFSTAYMNNDKLPDIQLKLDTLNALAGVDGFIFNQYSENGSAGRLYFSEHNGKKIDAIRTHLDEHRDEYTDAEYFYCLCSLIEAADKVANTTSVYGAYLKKIKKSAHKRIVLQPLDKTYNDGQNISFNGDANEIIKNISGDVLYMDPPYNSRQYSGNYHLLNTIALYDEFIPTGVTGQRPDNNKSAYCSKDAIRDAFDELIKNAKFEYIFVSYNNEGIMSMDEMRDIMLRYGEYKIYSSEYKTFKSDNSRNNKSETVYEYIHVLKKTGV